MHVSAVHEYPLPQIKPPLGLPAVPLPKKIRARSVSGFEPAAADTDATKRPGKALSGSPLLTAAAAVVTDLPDNSRRDDATADHANGNAAGPSPEPPPANQDNKS